MAFRVLTLNPIAAAGLARLPSEHYLVGTDVPEPDAILVRSADMHRLSVPQSVKAVARAGTGTNNIPVEALGHRGIPVFNAAGANANAVAELVVGSLFLAARSVFPAWQFTLQLQGDDAEIEDAVEQHKKRFVGIELAGRTLGVVGLGAIGVRVANAAHALGMHVLGHDPEITVQRAWQLASSVGATESLDALLRQSDAVTLHVPLVEGTRGLLDARRLAVLKPGALLVNFARAAIVDEAAVLESLERGHLRGYVTDFPNGRLKAHPRVIALPHLGASTVEAEELCAVMAADTLRSFLEHGDVRNSVNFPDASLPRTTPHRLVLANLNVPNIIGQVTTVLASRELNIADLLNRSRGELAYTLVDTDAPIPPELVTRIRGIQGVLSARLV